MKDRLKEMQERAKHYKEGETFEMAPLNDQNSDFNEFLITAEDLATNVSQVESNVNCLRILQKKVLNEYSREKREKFQSELSDLEHQNKVIGNKIRKTIQGEQTKIEKLEGKSSPSSKELSQLQIRKTQIQTHSLRFRDIWAEYNRLQVEYRDKTKEQLVKNIKITNTELSREEIEEKIDSGDTTIFTSILQETARAKEDLVAIENRHAEMLKLERGIIEIHDLFIDISNLVSQQGEMIDRIDHNIEQAGADVEEGRKQMGKAHENFVSANKKKVCLIGVGIVLLLIIILVILSEFGAFSGSDEKVIVREEIHHHHYVNGTTVVSDDAKLPQIVPPVAVTTTESVTTTTLAQTSQVAAAENPQITTESSLQSTSSVILEALTSSTAEPEETSNTTP